jgi:hypothetical protein
MYGGCVERELSASSRRLQSLQFGAAHLAEGAQRINRIAVHKFSQFKKRLVRCEVRIDNCSNGIVTLPREERGRAIRVWIFIRPRRPLATCSSRRRGARGVIELT